jgi:hypothetical protein
MLQTYYDRSNGHDKARTITVGDVTIAIVCTLPKDARTANKFCYFMWNIAGYANSPGCDVILQAGGIPVLFDCLRSWPAVKPVVEYACWALHYLTVYGSTTVKLAMRNVPNCEALLTAASLSKLDKNYAGDSLAELALEKLGFMKPSST